MHSETFVLGRMRRSKTTDVRGLGHALDCRRTRDLEDIAWTRKTELEKSGDTDTNTLHRNLRARNGKLDPSRASFAKTYVDEPKLKSTSLVSF